MNDENATDSIRPPVTHFSGCWREPGHHACCIKEVERMRAFIKQAEWEDDDKYCPWCGEVEMGGRGHFADCPAFTPDGRIKEQGEP